MQRTVPDSYILSQLQKKQELIDFIKQYKATTNKLESDITIAKATIEALSKQNKEGVE